jgi:hypothetical protein
LEQDLFRFFASDAGVRNNAAPGDSTGFPMSERQVEIICPCCSARLSIDTRTATVVRARRAGEVDVESGKPKVGDADWTDALSKVRKRTEGGESKLDSALERERGKSERLDELFRKAKDKLGDDESS